MTRRAIHAIDYKISSWVEKIPRSLRSPLARLSRATHPIVWGSMLALAVLVSLGLGYTQLALACLVTIILLPVEQLLKQIFRRKRPETMYVDNMKFRSYSFPSGHAYAAVVVLGLFTVIVSSFVTPLVGGLIGGLAFLLVLAIGVSRVYLGAHFPTDVIAGWIIGGGVFMLMLQTGFYV